MDLLKKLNHKEQNLLVVIQQPQYLRTFFEQEILGSIEVKYHMQPGDKPDFILFFAYSKSDISLYTEMLRERDGEDILLWFAYPKKASKTYRSDISRDNGWESLGELGYEPVRQIALDENWSALRFRKVEFIERFSRKENMVLSEQGRSRAHIDRGSDAGTESS